MIPFINTLRRIPERTEQLRFVLIALLVFSLPFDLFYSSILLIGLFAMTLLDINKTKIRRIPKQVWIFQLVYFLAVLGYFYSYHKNVAGFLLERQLSIFFLPLILPLAIEVDEVKVKQLLSVLALSCFIALAYLFLHMAYTIDKDLHLPFLRTVFSGTFFNHQFSRPIGIHAGYLSLYVALSVFYLVEVYNKTSVLRLKLCLACVMVVLFAGLFFLASRNIIIAVFFILIFISPLYNSKRKWRYILISILCLVIGFFIINTVPYLRERFTVQLLSDIKPLENGSYINYSSAEPRYERWDVAYDLIKQSPVIGYGTGDEIEMLKSGYMQKGLYISYIESFNAHNQYLSYLIKNGILGLALFLFGFYYYLKLAIRGRNFMYTSFLIMLLIGFYTENILDANKGIIFFALFNTFFGYAALNANKPGTEKSADL